jgi:predicted DsbA family dithiol-disulfide isomerase
MAERSVDEGRVLQVAERLGLDVEKLKKDMAAPEVQSVIDRNMKLAEALGIQGTPAFLIDEQLFPGGLAPHASTSQQEEQLAPTSS